MKRYVSLLLLPLTLLGAVDSSAIISYEKKIATHSGRADSLKNLINSGEETISKLKKEEATNLQQLNDIEENIELTRILISELSLRADSVAIDMKKARFITDSIGVELDARQKIMEERLRQIYKSGEITLPAIILGASSPSDALYRVRFAQDLNKYDRSIIDKIAEDKRRRNTEVAILSIQNEHYSELLEKKSVESEELVTQIGERQSLLESIRNEKRDWLSTVKELKNAQEELDKRVLALINKRDETAEELARKENFSFEKRKGKMIWPIRGEIISPFGKQVHPVHGTVITNKGIGISGKLGENVRAVAPGIVEYVGRLPGYGRVLIINHYGGYMTIYAHLSATSAKKGIELEAGATLGSVGESGSLHGPGVHFEVRNGAASRDPLDWLRKKEI